MEIPVWVAYGYGHEFRPEIYAVTTNKEEALAHYDSGNGGILASKALHS